MGYAAQAIYHWLVHYQQRGIAGLFDEPRRGRPLNERDLVATVQAQASQSPSCLGYPEAGWSVKGLLRHPRERFKMAGSPPSTGRPSPGWEINAETLARKRFAL
jgi:hypothetical protein